MSEEEILKNINIILEKSVDNRFFQTIKGILDLYNKQKEEIKNLKSENNYWIAKSYLLEKEKED